MKPEAELALCTHLAQRFATEELGCGSQNLLDWVDFLNGYILKTHMVMLDPGKAWYVDELRPGEVLEVARFDIVWVHGKPSD